MWRRLPLAGTGIEAWTECLDCPPEVVSALALALSPAERARAARMPRACERNRYVVGRARLREALGERLGVAPQSVELASGASGKPRLAGRFAASPWRFNLAHSGALAVLALARGREVGVDVEALRELPEADAIAERILAPADIARYRRLDGVARRRFFFAAWTRHEALSKARGEALRATFSQAPAGWRVRSFRPAARFAGALAWRQ